MQQGRDGGLWAWHCENITETAGPGACEREEVSCFQWELQGNLKGFTWYVQSLACCGPLVWEKCLTFDLPSQGSQPGTRTWCHYQPPSKDRGTGFLKASEHFREQCLDGYPPRLHTRQSHFGGFTRRWEVKWPHVRRCKLYTKPQDSKCTWENTGPRLCRVLLNEFLQRKLE